MQSSMNMNSETTITQLSDQFLINLKLNNDEKGVEIDQFDDKIDENDVEEDEHVAKAEPEHEDDDDEDEDDDDDDDFSFSMAFDGVIDHQSQITAEDAFSNGLIKPVYPFFNRDLLLQESVNNEELGQLKKIFVRSAMADSVSTSGNDSGSVVAGPYCDWDKKSVEICKKSNSTGFSKIWRFKDFMHRSSSDGKDAFVFLNHSPAAAGAAGAAGVSRKKKDVAESKVKGVAGESKMTVKGRKVVKSSKKAVAAAVPSPHEVYLRSKAKEEQRRRSYHSYRPEVVGLFTNITGGGLTRNVHPF